MEVSTRNEETNSEDKTACESIFICIFRVRISHPSQNHFLIYSWPPYNAGVYAAPLTHLQVENPSTAISASKTKELINDSPKGRKLKWFGQGWDSNPRFWFHILWSLITVRICIVQGSTVLPFFYQFYWDIINIKHCISFRYIQNDLIYVYIVK